MENTVHFVAGKPGDEADIQQLFGETFGVQRSLELWRWQFENHPRGRSWILLARAGEQLVGHFAFRRNHINFLGREIVAGQACDAMVHPDWRGRGIFTELFVRANAIAREAKLQVVFGFPSRSSYPVDMGRLDRQRIAYLRYYRRRIGFGRITGSGVDWFSKRLLLAGSGLRRRLDDFIFSPAWRIATTATLPAEADEMLAEWRRFEVLSLWKDPDYLRWRYEQHPENSYLYHCLFVEDRLEGLAVSRLCGTAAAICEFLHRNHKPGQSAALLRAIVRHYIPGTAQKIEFKGWDNGYFDHLFRSCGFAGSPSGIVLTAECFDHPRLKPMLPIPPNWTVVHGDMDVI